jgi:glycosyltransferase involved in cell wall biosynthesis
VNSPLRVLRVIARLNVGGPARHVTILDRGLTGLGFETLLAYGEVGPGEASLESLAEQATIPARKIRELGRRVSPWSDLRAFAALVALVFRFRPDVVHTHTAKAGTLGRLAAWLYNLTRPRRERCLVVHTFHGHVLHGYFSPVASRVVRGIERALGALTDRVLVLSPRQRDDIGRRHRIVPASRISIVPLGLELEALTGLPVIREQRAAVFGFVGRLVPIKNVPMLIDAFALVHRQLPGTRLVVVGDGDVRPEAERLVAAHGLQSAITFAGWRGDLAAVYRQIDVLVLTSLNEGTPVAVIEAMAAALPVVATDVGGVADVIDQGRTGVLVASQSVNELAAAMVAMARNPEERQRMGLAAREAVRTRFSAERLVADVAALYTAGVAAKRRPPAY